MTIIGCKNFTKLHDFRDKPEATKCIKCRQRGRQNYFAKKGRVDVLPNPHPRSSQSKHTIMVSSVANSHLTDPTHGGRGYATPYDMYADVDEAMAPRVTSSRQKDMQKNRLNRFPDRSMNMGGPNSNKYMKQGAGPAPLQQQQYPPDMMMIGFGARRDRSNSINSLLHGYNELPLDFQMYDGQDYDINNDDDEAGGGRSRSNTLLSVSSIYDGDKAKSSSNQQRRSSGTRNRTTSEEWGNLAQATAGGQFNLGSDMFKDSEAAAAHPLLPGTGIAGGSAGLPPTSTGVVAGAGSDGPRKRRVSIDLTNYFGGGATWSGGADDGDAEPGSSEAFETKRARNNSISEILSSII